MLKHFSFAFWLLIYIEIPALGMQDPAMQGIMPRDSLTKAVTAVDSSKAVDSLETTATNMQIRPNRSSIDSLAFQDTTLSALRADTLSASADSLEEAKTIDMAAQVEPPQIADTTNVSRLDTAVAGKTSAPMPDTVQSDSASGTLPQSISEEARSAEENILRQLEGLASILSLPRIILTLIVFFATYFVTKIVTVFLTQVARRRTRMASKLRTAIPLLSFGIWFFAAYLVIVGIFARSPLSIVIVMAVLVLAFFIAARKLLQDLVGGIVILFERPFQIGDRIRTLGHYGEVVKIGLRAVRLLATDGSVVVIPNAEIMRQSIANANAGNTESLVITELMLPASVDIEAARRIVFEAAAVSPFVYMRKPIEVQVEEEYKSELLTKLVVRAYVFDARYENELRSHIITRSRKWLQRRPQAFLT